MRLKEPGEKLDYGFDYTDWLEDGDTITASSWTVPTDLNETDPTFGDTSTTVWLAGGTLGSVYTITNTVTSAAGRIELREFDLRIAVVSIEAFLESLANGGGAGSRTAAELPEHRLVEHLENANVEAVGRLFRYTVADPAPQLLKSLVIDLAAYTATLEWNGSQPLEDRDPIVLRYNRARALLTSIAKGETEVAGIGADTPGEAVGEPEAYGSVDVGLAQGWVDDTASAPGYWHGMSQGRW